jgi:hypothetical protein
MKKRALSGGLLFLPAFGAATVGCSGGSGNTDGGVAPTFTSVYSEILQPSCGSAQNGVGCHQSASEVPSGSVVTSGLDFSTKAAAYAGLVGVQAMGTFCGTYVPPDGGGEVLTRVVAGNAQESLLYLKVADANPPCGVHMPRPIPPATDALVLSQADITLIEEWINAGALNN